MATYIFYREQVLEYYKELVEFSLTSRSNTENTHIKNALNLNIILSSACYVEGYMEKTAKCALGYFRLVYNAVNIPEFELRKPMNKYFTRIEADIYQRISQGTGIDNYDKLFNLLLGKSFKQQDSFKPLLESIQVLFQLRNVLAHAKEISSYEVSAYWNNNTFEENFWGGYKKAENFLIKKGILEDKIIKMPRVERFFIDPVADYFYNISQQFIQQLQFFVESNIEFNDILTNKLDTYNKKNGTNLSIMDFCELNAHATNE